MTGIGAPPAAEDLRGFPSVGLPEGLAVYRIHRATRGPWWFTSAGYGRFDLAAPRGTWYAAHTPQGAFIEVFGEVTVIPQNDVRAKRLSELVLPRPFRLADVTVPAALGRGVTLELSAGIRGGAPYAHTQPWAEAFADAGFEGIRYLCRHDPSAGQICYALFGEAGERDHPPAEHATTPIRQELIESVRERYGLIVLPEP